MQSMLPSPSDLLLDLMNMKTFCLWIVPVLILLQLGIEQVESKKYQRCELTRVLVENYNFDKTFISNCKSLLQN